MPRLRFPRQPGRNQPIHRAETLWVYPAPIPVRPKVWAGYWSASMLPSLLLASGPMDLRHNLGDAAKAPSCARPPCGEHSPDAPCPWPQVGDGYHRTAEPSRARPPAGGYSPDGTADGPAATTHARGEQHGYAGSQHGRTGVDALQRRRPATLGVNPLGSRTICQLGKMLDRGRGRRDRLGVRFPPGSRTRAFDPLGQRGTRAPRRWSSSRPGRSAGTRVAGWPGGAPSCAWADRPPTSRSFGRFARRIIDRSVKTPTAPQSEAAHQRSLSN